MELTKTTPLGYDYIKLSWIEYCQTYILPKLSWTRQIWIRDDNCLVGHLGQDLQEWNIWQSGHGGQNVQYDICVDNLNRFGRLFSIKDNCQH